MKRQSMNSVSNKSQHYSRDLESAKAQALHVGIYEKTAASIESLERTINNRLVICCHGNLALCTVIGVIVGSELYVHSTVFNFGVASYVEALQQFKSITAMVGVAISLFTLIGLSAGYRAIKDREECYNRSVFRDRTCQLYAPAMNRQMTNVAGMLCDMSLPFFFVLLWVIFSGWDVLSSPLYIFEFILLMIGLACWPLTKSKSRAVLLDTK